VSCTARAACPSKAAAGGCWWDWVGKNKAVTRNQRLANPLNPASLAAAVPGLSAEQEALITTGGKEDWRGDARYLPALSEAGVPVARRAFGIGHYLRPCMVEFIGCTDVLLQGYQLVDSPFWQHHPVASKRVQIRKVRMESMGPNNDGFDPESCDTVLVDGCLFNTGDDCIAIKSGKNRDTSTGPTRNMVIQNCIMNSGHGGVTLGSEMAAGIEHIYAQKIDFRNVHWAGDPLGTAIRMKTNMNRGGFLRHFYVRDVTVPNGVKTTAGFYNPLPGSAVPPKTASTSGGAVITIDCDYAPADDGVRIRPPQVSSVHISNVRVGNVKTPEGEFSCYQALVILGPVATSFNGPAGTPILPLPVFRSAIATSVPRATRLRHGSSTTSRPVAQERADRRQIGFGGVVGPDESMNTRLLAALAGAAFSLVPTCRHGCGRVPRRRLLVRGLRAWDGNTVRSRRRPASATAPGCRQPCAAAPR
jgi:polygalacturonase